MREEWRARLHEYFGGVVRGLEGVPLKIGGVQDHIHALIGLKPTHCLADFSRELKKSASVWSSAHHERQFAWQEGYAVFAVSKSRIETVARYIERQERHHEITTFEQELRELLEKHGVKYDPKYLV
jgi:putative transposase